MDDNQSLMSEMMSNDVIRTQLWSNETGEALKEK